MTQSLTSLGVAVLTVLAIADTVLAQCDLVAVHDAKVVIGAQSIDVRVGSLDSRWSTPFTPSFANRVLGIVARPGPTPDKVSDDLAARVEAALALSLSDALRGPGAPVSAAGGSARLVLRADIAGVNPGNRAVRVVTGRGRASAAVRAVLTSTDGRPLAAVVCDRSTAGGLFGAGGLFALAQSGESLLRDNFRKIAQSIAKQLARTQQVATTLSSRRREEVETGELRYSNKVWRERPPERWSLKDATSVLGNFMTLTYRGRPVGGPPVLLRGVHALWMARPVCQAIRQSQALIEEGERSVWIHPFSLVFEEETLRVIEEEEDAYAIAVWPWDKAPVYWNPEAIVASTFLRRADRPDERIPPIGLVGTPWPPALFLFPRTTLDGRPLIESVETVLELHTRLNGRQIFSRFDLTRLGLPDLTVLDP
jgi:hypothetical protein